MSSKSNKDSNKSNVKRMNVSQDIKDEVEPDNLDKDLKDESGLTLSSLDQRLKVTEASMVTMNDKMDLVLNILTANKGDSKGISNSNYVSDKNVQSQVIGKTPSDKRRESLLASFKEEGNDLNDEFDAVKQDADKDVLHTSEPDTQVLGDMGKVHNRHSELIENMSFGKSDKGNERSYLHKRLQHSYLEDTDNQGQIVKFEMAKRCPAKIDRLSLLSSTHAIQAIIDYQEEEEVQVRIQKVLSRPAKEHLRLAYGFTNQHISKMKTEDLLKIIAYETRVNSMEAFYEELNSAITVKIQPPWKQVNPVNHQEFYYQQLKFISQFRSMLGIMLDQNSQYCPLVDDKPFGLITLFKYKNDMDYMRFAAASMKTRKFATMTEYLNAFGEVVLKDYEKSRIAKDLPYEDNKKYKSTYRQRQSKYENYQNARDKVFNKPEGLHNLEKDKSEFEGEEDIDWKCYFEEQEFIPGNIADQLPEELFDEDEEGLDMNDLKLEMGKRSNVSQEVKEIPVEQLDNMDKQQTTQQGCLKYILRGSCNKGASCKFLHSKEACMKTADEFVKKMYDYKNGNVNNKETPSNGVKILRKTGGRL